MNMNALLRCTAATAAAWLLSPAMAQWGHLTITATTPGPRTGALLAYDVASSRMLMFGGNWTSDMWSLVGNTWTQLSPSTMPAPRARANLAVNPTSGEILLYGGDGGSGQFALDETWSWNGTDWQQLTPATTPGGLARHGMAYDMTRQVMVVFGGRQNSWLPNQAFDTTWEYSNGNWVQVVATFVPPPRCDMGMSFHPALGQVMIFGGSDSTSSALGDTWVYDGTTWTQINTTGTVPPPRVGGKLVPVLGRNLCVLSGGRDPVTMEIRNDTWEHDGVSWTQIANVHGGVYPPRDKFGIAHDFTRDRLVLYGGVIANGAVQDDTWEYGAHFQPFGMGCMGSGGVPALTGGALPKLGSVTTATLSNLPPSSPFAFMAVGLSRTQWAFGSLPMLLTALGMPGCRSYTSADLLAFVPAAAGSGVWSFAVPPVASLVGADFYLQGLSWDPGINPMGLTTSNAATLVVGN